MAWPSIFVLAGATIIIALTLSEPSRDKSTTGHLSSICAHQISPGVTEIIRFYPFPGFVACSVKIHAANSSLMLQTWSVNFASIAGVTRKV